MEATTNRSGLQCQEHPRQEITNFCIQFDCLKPLCPDCVEVHTKTHQTQDIQSWRHCINKCISQSKATIDELKSIYQKQRQTKGFKSVDIIQSENLRRLNNLRQKYHRLVDQIFNSHQNALRTQIRTLYRIQTPDTSKLKLAIEEMEKVIMKLANSSTVVAAVKKCLLLDHRSLIEHFSYMKNLNLKHPNEVFFSENTLNQKQLRTLLQKCINLETAAFSQNYQKNSADYSSPYNQKIPLNSARDRQSMDPFQPLVIYNKEYFKQDCKNKLLHFFIPCSSELKILKIQEAAKSNWKTIFFKAEFQLPSYFSSIITPSGDIFLTGGMQELSNSHSNQVQELRLRQIYRYNFQKNCLQEVSTMISERSSHCLCYMDGQIYIIGGFSGVGDVLRDCEVFNLQKMTCSKIAPLNTPSANSCATAFNNQYIFKFGGIFNKEETNSLIEMYSVKNDRWIVVNIQTPKNVPALNLLSFSAAVQINQTQILVFGGYDNTELQKPQRLCYTLKVNIQKKSVLVKNYNTNPLVYAQGFWNNNPIIYKRSVYALQNITDQQDEQTALADERRVIIFNGERWL